MKFRRMAGALGAEVSGVDLSRPLDPGALKDLRAGWIEHQVLFFRDQPLSLAQYDAFARQWGTPVEYPMVKGLEGYPTIHEVKKLEHEKNAFGGIWHTDTAYLPTPPMASMLLAREIPPYGGDTLFASLYAAYDALSEGMKALLAPLKGVNTSAKADVSKTREDRLKTDAREGERKDYTSEHPVVRTHPESGKKALYVNLGHTARFAGLTEEESAPILQYLFQHCVKPEFTCRFTWQVGSLALWDNRCVLHNPVNDYHGFRRIMHRITLAGDKPV